MFQATPENYSHRAGRFNNLGNLLEDRYKRTGTMADLEEAIQITEKQLTQLQ